MILFIVLISSNELELFVWIYDSNQSPFISYIFDGMYKTKGYKIQWFLLRPILTSDFTQFQKLFSYSNTNKSQG